jgi:uncharacterized protein
MATVSELRAHARVAVALVLALCAGSAQARDVADLYSATVPVPDRSSGELARGASAALSQVMVKLTGMRTSPANPALRPLYGRAGKLLLSYAYEASAGGDGLVLRADFDERALATELASAGVATWGKERPDTLVWLVVDDGMERRIAAADEPGAFAEVMLARAAARGIPLLLPLLDIAEAQALGQAPDWPALRRTALALGARYATPAMLVAQVVQSAPGLWEAQWSARIAQDELDWSQEGDLPELVVEEGVDALADALARRYADPGMLAAAERLTLTVVGVRDAADYARLAGYLATLDTVGELFVHGVDNQSIRFGLTARGGRAALAQSFTFGQVLAPSGQADVWQMRR